MIYHSFDKLKQKDGKTILLPVGDIHCGSKYCDLDRVAKLLKWAEKEENVYILGMGDLIEIGTKASPGASVFEQDSFAQEQLERIIELFEPLAKKGRIIGLLDGNHEERTYKQSGFNIMKTLARILNTKYFGFSAAIKLKVGNNNYSVYAVHGSSGSKLPTTKLKAVMDLERIIQADIYLHGHVHDLRVIEQPYYAFNYHRKVLEECKKHFVLTGSYLTYFGSYAQNKNMTPGNLGSPKIELNAEERDIKISLD